MRFDPDEPRAVARERVLGRMREQSGDGRHSMLTVALAVSIFIGTGAVGFWQATEPTHVRDQLELGMAELTDIDTYVAVTVPELRQVAVRDASATIQLPAYPIAVSVTRDELLDLPDPALRDLILERTASIVYVQGLEAFDRTGNQEISLLSSEWFLERIIGLLTGGWHGRAQAVAVLGYLAATVAGAFMFARRGTVTGLRTCGFAALAGAFPGFVFMAAAAYWFGHTGGGDAFVRSIAAILETFFMVPRRDYLVVVTLGAFLAALSYALPLIDRLVVAAAAGRPQSRPRVRAAAPTPGASVSEAEIEAPLTTEPGRRSPDSPD